MSNLFEVVTVTLNPAIDQTVTIPNFAPGAVNRVETSRANAGGKGVNVAAALADYGLRVAATGFLGSENTALFDQLFSHKLIGDYFVRIPGQTRVGIKIADPAQQQTTDLNFPGASVGEGELARLRTQLRALNQDGQRWFVLAGSLPPGVPSDWYAQTAEMLRDAGHRVALDTSGEPLRAALSACPALIKPNLHELEELLGRSLPNRAAVATAARELVARGIELVVISMGADGALLVTRDEEVLATPPAITVTTTVGAGDAMVSGVLAGRLRGLSLGECARLGTAFSLEALTCGQAGVRSAAGLQQFMQQVSLS